MTRAVMGAKKRVWRSRGAGRGCQVKSTPPSGRSADDVARIIAEVRHDTGDSGFPLVDIVQARGYGDGSGSIKPSAYEDNTSRPGSLRKVESFAANAVMPEVDIVGKMTIASLDAEMVAGQRSYSLMHDAPKPVAAAAATRA